MPVKVMELEQKKRTSIPVVDKSFSQLYLFWRVFTNILTVSTLYDYEFSVASVENRNPNLLLQQLLHQNSLILYRYLIICCTI